MLTLTARPEGPRFVLGNVYLTFNLQAVFCLFETSPMVYLMDGWDGWDGPEKCPLIFFILCGYLDYVYINIYKKITNVLMGFKF